MCERRARESSVRAAHRVNKEQHIESTHQCVSPTHIPIQHRLAHSMQDGLAHCHTNTWSKTEGERESNTQLPHLALFTTEHIEGDVCQVDDQNRLIPLHPRLAASTSSPSQQLPSIFYRSTPALLQRPLKQRGRKTARVHILRM